MGYDFYLFDGPIQIVGTEHVSDLDFFELIKHENGLFYYRPKDFKSNLNRWLKSLALELKNINPVIDVKLVYFEEYCEMNFIVEAKNGKVTVYEAVITVTPGKKILEV